MKTQKHYFLFTAFLALMLVACSQFDASNDCINGEGAIIEQEVIIEDFSSVNLASSFNVVITQGETQKIVVRGQQNIIDSLNTKVSDNQWTACLKPGCYSVFNLTVYVTLPAIDKISVTGSGNIELQDFNQQNDLTVVIAGSGNITMNDFASAENLYASLKASGDFYANENVDCFKNMEVKCTGSGNFNGYNIKTNRCEAETMGSGKCFVSASDKLKATISGSGDIYYRGNPEITSSIIGSGKLVPAS